MNSDDALGLAIIIIVLLMVGAGLINQQKTYTEGLQTGLEEGFDQGFESGQKYQEGAAAASSNNITILYNKSWYFWAGYYSKIPSANKSYKNRLEELYALEGKNLAGDLNPYQSQTGT